MWELASAADRTRFSGRREELGTLTRLVRLLPETRIIHLVGPPGIGKSALLRELARSVASDGVAVLWVDGRDPAPWEGVTADARGLVVIDNADEVPGPEVRLRDQLLGTLPGDTVVVLGRRRPPHRDWYDGGWASVVGRLDVGPLPDADAEQLVRSAGLQDPDAVRAALRRCRGWPAALELAAAHGGNVDASALAERIMGDDLSPGRLGVLGVAALVRVSTPALLAVVVGPDNAEAFRWLAGRSFMQERLDGLVMDPLVAGVLGELLQDRDPEGLATLRARLAHHLQDRLHAGDVGAVHELQRLVQDPAFSHAVGDVPADLIAVLRMLRIPRLLEKGPAWLGTTAAERREVLQGWVESALQGFGNSPDDRLAVQIIREAYLDGQGSHETIARRLHLSRSAYFRRLGAALARIAADVPGGTALARWDGSGTD